VRIPRYVHAMAIAVGAIAAAILWRTGSLPANPFMKAVGVLIPPGAVYFFYLQSRTSDTDARGDDVRNRDRDV